MGVNGEFRLLRRHPGYSRDAYLPPMERHKAVAQPLDRHVVSLDPAWDGQIEVLRGWGRAGRLVCPVCRQAVLLRAGEIMRRHFAHKDLSQCPLSRESAELLAGRAALYACLNTKFPDGVTLEDADSAISRRPQRGAELGVSAA